MNIQPNQIIKLLKLIYVISESGDYKRITFTKRLENSLGLKSDISDAALFFKTFGETLLWFCASQ